MAAPQTEKELLATLAEREDTLKRIKALQAEIAKGGFIPADQVKHNELLAERLRLMGEQKRIEGDIKRANPTAADAVRVQMAAREQLAAAREQQRLAADRLRISQQARLLDLRERYGSVLGGAAGRIEQAGQSRFAKVAGAGLTAFGAAAGGMARSGFQGTVEQNALDYEWKMLAREFAGVFKPVFELVTMGANKLRRFMEGLDETGQNLVLLASGLGAAGMVARMTGIGGIGRAVVGGMMGGPGGAILGGMMGGFGGGGSGGGGSGGGGRGGGGGAMDMALLAGSSVGGGGAAAAKAGTFWGRARTFGGRFVPGWGKVAAVGSAMVVGNQFRDGQSSEEFRTRHGENADALDQMQSTGGSDALLAEYQRLRAGRSSAAKFQSWVGGGFGYAGQERDTIDELERRLQSMGVTPGTGRRKVTPAEASYEDVGSAYKRASLSFLNSTAMEASQAGDKSSPAWANVEIGKQIAATLELIQQNTAKTPEVK